MNLHEHQAKALLRRYDLPLPKGGIAETPEEASALAQVLGGERWVVKAQIHAGLRQKAGGIKFAASREEVSSAAKSLLGRALVTGQTGPEGQEVKAVYVEQAVDVDLELYVAALVDRNAGCITLLASPAGGEGVETSLATAQEIQRLPVSATIPPRPEDFTALGRHLGLDPDLAGQAAEIFTAVWHAFVDNDATLIELNPLALTSEGRFAVLDAKIVLDDNALFRHPDLEALRDANNSDPLERAAHGFELNYVKLDGNIGLAVSGAGLCLASIDLIKQKGGAPANFMDVRPVATAAQIASGLGLMMESPDLRVLLVNTMGGGLLRCDTMAEGLAQAYQRAKRKLPIVFRAAGTAKEIAELTLRNQAIPAAIFDDLDAAVEKAVQLAEIGDAA